MSDTSSNIKHIYIICVSHLVISLRTLYSEPPPVPRPPQKICEVVILMKFWDEFTPVEEYCKRLSLVRLVILGERVPPCAEKLLWIENISEMKNHSPLEKPELFKSQKAINKFKAASKWSTFEKLENLPICKSLLTVTSSFRIGAGVQERRKNVTPTSHAMREFWNPCLPRRLMQSQRSRCSAPLTHHRSA